MDLDSYYYRKDNSLGLDFRTVFFFFSFQVLIF